MKTSNEKKSCYKAILQDMAIGINVLDLGFHLI